MIIKEFRLVMPMSVEEYQIGQLYTIQKKSRLESEGVGSGVEIRENKPYEDENGKGQYTLKYYHVDHKLPPNLKTLVGLIFPKSALIFEEEAWNRYPYTRTVYKNQLYKGFSIDIETRFNPDIGDQDNVFNLSKAELANRVVEYVDIVKDTIQPNNYKEAEDPKLFKSTKTGRGPLSENWYEELKAQVKTQSANTGNGKKLKYMCAYKLCRIECNIWGFQSRIEKSISDTVIRGMLLVTHRQAWCWQDEYIDLTMEQIRLLEAETQKILKEKMSANVANNRRISKAANAATTSTNSINSSSKNDSSNRLINENSNKPVTPIISVNANHYAKEMSNGKKPANKILKSKNILSKSGEYDDFDDKYNDVDDEDEKIDFGDSISIKSNDEFYDAISYTSDTNSFFSAKRTISPLSTRPSTLTNISEAYQKDQLDVNFNLLSSQSSASSSNQNSPIKSDFNRQPSIISTNMNEKIDILVMVVHGGNVMSINSSKSNDFTNLKSTFEKIIESNYKKSKYRLSYRLVPCDDLCHDVLVNLSALSTYNQQKTANNDTGFESPIGFNLYEYIPYHVLPLFAFKNREDYIEKLLKLIKDLNQVYEEYKSIHDIPAQVVIIGDSMGAILAFDAITYESFQNDAYSSSSGSLQQTSLSSTPVGSQPLLINHKNIYAAQMSCPAGGLTINNISKQNQNMQIPEDDEMLMMKTSSSLISRALSIDTNKLDRLEFAVTHFFSFGSLLGLLLAFRKYTNGSIPLKLPCKQMYNLFHLNDPLAIRIEPLLCKQFSCIPPFTIPRSSKFPYGDGTTSSLEHFILNNQNLFCENGSKLNKNETQSNEELNHSINASLFKNMINIKDSWWGSDRIDYILYAPEHLVNLPKQTLPYLFHGCYWESNDVVSFILRTLMKDDDDTKLIENGSLVESKKPIEKWIHRSNRVKLRNLAPNHRANDVVVLEDRKQVLKGKFSYGPLDFALSSEKVDIYISINRTTDWEHYSTEVTDNHGKLKYELPHSKRLPLGMYSVKMVVRCDQSSVNFNICVVPANTEAVVFSIDGSFAANISLSGTDPKVRAGAVDIVRHWQELGYLIIYISARPDVQQCKVTNWLAQHNFPHGMTFFSDGISPLPIKQKAETLKSIVTSNNLRLIAGYGSTKDILMYLSLGLEPQQIFIIGKTKKKYQSMAVCLNEGYASHLNYLKANSRSAVGNARLILKKSSFFLRNNNYSISNITSFKTLSRSNSNKDDSPRNTSNLNAYSSIKSNSSNQ